jgi:AcrR family transcriptional regulator
MSSQNATAAKRPYRKRRRAELEEETRLRITEAAVDLHGSVGPAKTTISAVAERAGVQRATVYRHFADEEALFGACSAHWLAQHPVPDIAEWAAIEDPSERLRTALDAIYAWYEAGEEMLERVVRDAPLVPALRTPVEARRLWLGMVVESVMPGRPERGRRRRRVEAALGHAVAFETWRSLVREQGLPAAEAVGLMAAMVEAAPGDR